MATNLEAQIKAWIGIHEKLGDSAGGSHHLGHRVIEIVSIDPPASDGGKQTVSFSYRIHTLSEFEQDDDLFPPPPLKTGEITLAD